MINDNNVACAFGSHAAGDARIAMKGTWVVVSVLVAFLASFYLTSTPDASGAPDPAERVCDISQHEPAAQRFAKFLTFHTLAHLETSEHIKEGHEQAFTEMLQFMEAEFPSVYETLAVEKVGLGGWSRLFTWTGSDPSQEPVLFISHYDVVPVANGTEQDWEHPPFGGVIADGYVWGRGALDIKFSVMALLEAVTQLLHAGYTPRRTLIFSFGHDEEVGGSGGAAEVAQLLQSRGVKLDVVIDEGGLIFEDGAKGMTSHPVAIIGTAEKLYTSVHMALRSAGGHSSMPPIDGSDIATQMARVITHVASHPPPAVLRAPMTEFLAALAPYAHPLLRGILPHAHRWPLNHLLGLFFTHSSRELAALARTTTAVTRVSAGVADNVLPNTGLMNWNMRSHPDVPREEVLAYLENAAKAVGVNATLTVTPISHMGPQGGVTSSRGRHFKLLQLAVQEHWRAPNGRAVAVAPFLLTGGTDSKWFAHITRHGILRFVPYAVNKTAGDVGRIHSANERVRVADYGRAICTYARVLELFGQS